MDQMLNVLLVEDSEDDAWVVLREFEKRGIRFKSHRVQSSASLQEALDRQEWDIVISDYRMPRFSGMTALAAVRVRYPDLPFILLSGTVEESVANIALKTGATAFASKDEIGKLIPLVERELARAKVNA